MPFSDVVGSCIEAGHNSCCIGLSCQGSLSNNSNCFCDAECETVYGDCCRDVADDCQREGEK